MLSAVTVCAFWVGIATLPEQPSDAIGAVLMLFVVVGLLCAIAAGPKNGRRLGFLLLAIGAIGLVASMWAFVRRT